MSRLNFKNEGDEHNFWQNYTDLMSGFLVVFIITSLVAWYGYIKVCLLYTSCRNIGMIENIVMQMLIRLTDYKNDISVCRRKYVENVLQVQIELIYRVELLSKRKELCNIEILNKIDKMIFSYNLDFYKKFSNQAMYMVSYVKYFRKGIIFPNRFRHLLLLLQKLENSLKR